MIDILIQTAILTGLILAALAYAILVVVAGMAFGLWWLLVAFVVTTPLLIFLIIWITSLVVDD